MTNTESCYAQIEKKALAVTWTCEKFASYIQGKTITLETNHKPLVPLLSDKHFDDLLPRVLRFYLRLMRFDFVILHVPGKLLHAAGALSRAPLKNSVDYLDQEQAEDTEFHVRAVVSAIPPDKHSLPLHIKPYWKFQGDLSLADDLLLYHNRIIVPEKLQMETLNMLHCGHQGIQRCRLRARSSVWWLNISRIIQDYISHAQNANNPLYLLESH